jgi:hypothetical protein
MKSALSLYIYVFICSKTFNLFSSDILILSVHHAGYFKSALWALGGGCRVMVFIATFNNISAILWWSVLLVEETGVPVENYRPASSH